MFLGRYEHTIDDKGRLIVPVRYRDDLKNGAYVTQGFEKNLVVHTQLTFNKLYEELNQTNLADPYARQLKRLILSNAEKVELDRVGRILIPQFLREVAQIRGSVLLVGVGDSFEIWSMDLWKEEQARLQETERDSDHFAAFNLSTR
jgi:MraZ protein